MMGKFIKILLIVIFLLVSSCSRNVSLNCYVYYNQLSARQYHQVNYTPTGLKNYKESEKKIRKENREYRKIQNKRIKKIYRLQTANVIPYKN